MEIIQTKIRKTFDKCQERQYNLAKLAEALKKFYIELSSDPDKKKTFVDEFLFCVDCLLQESDRDLAVERCVQFVAIFSAHFADTCDDEEVKDDGDANDNLYNEVIAFITRPEIYCHSNKTIRFRVCQLIQLLLGAVPQNVALDEDLMDSMTKVMLDRIQDKIATVRAQAARSLCRLQQPQIKDCPVIKAYLFHIAFDESPPVRASVLSNISLTTQTLPAVLDRTRDVSESVRKMAFQIIAQKVSIKALTSTQRLYLIKQGLLDRSDAVKDVVKKQLFQNWLLNFDGNLLHLLKKLDVVGAYDTCCKAVTAMFQCSRLSDLMEGFDLLNQKKLIDFDQLTPQSAVYWCQLCEFMKKKGIDGDQHLDSLLPSSLLFAEYMDNYVQDILVPFMSMSKEELSPENQDDMIEKEFVAEQLVKIATGMDLSDNAGRKAMNEVLKKAIISLNMICFPRLIPPLACALLELQASNQPLESDENEKASLLASMISTIRDPGAASPSPNDLVLLNEAEVMKIKQQLAKVAVSLNEANEGLRQCVAAKDFVKAGEIQDKIDKIKQEKENLNEQLKPKVQELNVTVTTVPEKSDVATLVKCLIMVKEVLSSIFECRCIPSRMNKSPPRGIHPTLLQLLETLVVPLISNNSPSVRRQAIRCLGVGCMYSAPLAQHHFNLLMQMAQDDTYIVRIAAINALNDLIRMFGIKTLTSNNAKSNQGSSSEKEEDEDSSNSSTFDENIDMCQAIMDKFLEMLDDKEMEVRLAASSLLASVLVSHRVLSPAVVVRLVLLWYDPGTRDDPAVMKTVSNFLDVFPYMSREAHQCIQTSFLPILRILFNAPPTSPYASVNINNVAELIVNITRPSIVQNADLKAIGITQDTRWLNEWSAHDDFAVMVSNEVLSDPLSPFVNSLCRIFSLLDLNPAQTNNIRDLEALTANMMKEVKDKQAIRDIRKFQTQISSLAKLAKTNKRAKTSSAEDEISETVQKGEVARITSALQEIDVNPSNIPENPDPHLDKQTIQIGNPKRNLRSAFDDALTTEN